jgi:phospholipid/cholesterol/gamma-HCH transport system substrate-binding protein
MNRFAFYFFVSLGVLFLFGLWFFLHPNSPWHSRNHYKIAFEEVGNLRAGDLVNANGMLKGYVKDFELTDSCVWTEIAVLAEVKIPVDSRFNIANAGLMGERVIEITLGESGNYYANGERIMGYFDIGSTTIGNLALDILNEANYIVDILADVADTLFSEDKAKGYKKLGQKAKQLGNKTSSIVNMAESSVMASVDSLAVAKDKIAEIIDNMKPDLDGMAKNANDLQKSFAILEKHLEDIKNSVNSIAQKLENGDNTISLALNKEQDGDLRRQMKKISEDAEKLMEKIRKGGLDLNVDIF